MINKRKKSFNILSGLIIIILAILLFLYLYNTIFNTKAKKTFFSESQRIEISFNVEGFILKEEKLYYSPADGKVKRLKEAGELLKKGTEAAQIIKQDNSILSLQNEEGGLITFIKDNCEVKYSQDKFENLLIQEIINPPIKKERVAGNQSVREGDFIFKIVNNDNAKYVLVFDNRNKNRLSINDSVSLIIEDPISMILSGTVEKIEDKEENKCILILSVTYNIEPMLNERKVKGKITFGTITGSYIPKSSVIKNKENENIVYIRRNDNIEALKINIVGEDSLANNYIVENLSDYQEIYYDAKIIESK